MHKTVLMNIQMVLLRGFRPVLFHPSVVLKCGLMVLLGWNIHLVVTDSDCFSFPDSGGLFSTDSYTDNMKSVTTRRLADGTPVWNTEYEAFQKLVGFRTRLCRTAHPFTKGQVERLARYVKGNFVQGRRFPNITELNRSARDADCHRKRPPVPCSAASE